MMRQIRRSAVVIFKPDETNTFSVVRIIIFDEINRVNIKFA